MNMTLFFAAMYLSEGWYDKWQRDGSLYAKTRAMVLFDRVVTVRTGYDLSKDEVPSDE